MKTFPLLFVLLFGVLLSLPTESQAQWQTDVRLTYDPGLSLTAYNNGWRIAANGDVVHAVWADDGDGNLEIYYKRSVDGGITWGPDLRVTSNTAESHHPSVSVSGSVLHVVWQDNRDGNFEIYYKRSTDGGIGWGGDTRLTNDSAESRYPSAAVSGQAIHVVWYDSRDGNEEIYYKRSTDGGSSWGTDTRLSNDPAWSTFASVSVSGSVVLVVWADLRDAGWEIYYKRSADGGISWGPETRLTYSIRWAEYPSVSVSGSVVHVVWQDDRHTTEEVYYIRSTDGGASWGAETRLTNNTAWSLRPCVSVSGSVVHVVWHDYRDGNAEIYYKRSPDGGSSWEADTRLTSNSAYSENPSVSASGSPPNGGVHVVWQDDRDGNYGIYYEGDPTGNTVGVKAVSSEIPNQCRLEQNYPNPFNPSTTIEFSVAEARNVVLKMFNTLGQGVATLVSGELSPGRYKSEWNSSGVPSGVYFYRLEATPEKGGIAFIDVKKIIVMK